MISVRFVYSTGIRREVFRNVKLVGTWDASGIYSDAWSAPPQLMTLEQSEDGCPSYVASVQLDPSGVGREFHWGVRLDAPQQTDIWGVPTEVKDRFSSQRHLSLVLNAAGGEQRYYLTHCHRIGAQKRYMKGKSDPAIEFSVWAPNAKNVETVIGKYDNKLQEKNSGYISDGGDGIDTTLANGGVFSMRKDDNDLWRTGAEPQLAAFTKWDHKPYMFRVTKDDGKKKAYQTDLYSRCQIGKGDFDPGGKSYSGSFVNLEGTKSCSVVIDPEKVTAEFEEPAFPETKFISQEAFWTNEFDPSRPLPRRIEDLIIYELHVGSLGLGEKDKDGKDRAGNFGDVREFLENLVDLGVNAVELMPVLQFEGSKGWGYGTSHPFALEFSAGGRDQLKYVVRSCHRRGLAVIMDVVYNHYHVDAERAEWAYDSNAPERNIYYWYEGHPSDYPSYEAAAQANPNQNPPGQGGYLDNYSTGFDPRVWEENVRKWFISGAVTLAEEFHVDGFRVDLPQALYQFNVRHGDGVPVDSANAFGAKFLREWTRTLKMIRPQCFLIAEDHSDQAFVTDSPDRGGLGFDATWYSTFYHHLIGDGNYGANYARLLYVAGLGDDQPLAMDYFAGALNWSGHRKVVYHEDHDDAGNAANTARTMVTAVNGAPLTGETRVYAEARSRCICGIAMLSGGTPMFLMGEEIASANPLPYKDFLLYRDDFKSERAGNGARMFKFYQDLIRLRRSNAALRSREIDVFYSNNPNRVIAFLRTDGVDRFLIVAGLNNHAFSSGYWIATDVLGNAGWREVFNSDSGIYGGQNIGNAGTVLSSSGAGINLIIPRNGFVVFQETY
jgi:1,4-alpha-glucan branching enzyme